MSQEASAEVFITKGINHNLDADCIDLIIIVKSGFNNYYQCVISNDNWQDVTNQKNNMTKLSLAIALTRQNWDKYLVRVLSMDSVCLSIGEIKFQLFRVKLLPRGGIMITRSIINSDSDITYSVGNKQYKGPITSEQYDIMTLNFDVFFACKIQNTKDQIYLNIKSGKNICGFVLKLVDNPKHEVKNGGDGNAANAVNTNIKLAFNQDKTSLTIEYETYFAAYRTVVDESNYRLVQIKNAVLPKPLLLDIINNNINKFDIEEDDNYVCLRYALLDDNWIEIILPAELDDRYKMIDLPKIDIEAAAIRDRMNSLQKEYKDLCTQLVKLYE